MKPVLSNSKMALFVGAGVSKLLKIPLWEELAERAIDHLKDNNDLNYSEAERLKHDRPTAKQVLSIYHRSVRDKAARRQFYEKHLGSESNSHGNPYELLLELERALDRPVLKISTNIDLEWEKALKADAERQKNQVATDGQGHSVKPSIMWKRSMSASAKDSLSLRPLSIKFTAVCMIWTTPS